MVTIKIYIEGGGEGKDLDRRFREAWTRFFAKAGLGTMPRPVRGKGRKNTFDLFSTAVKSNDPSVLPLLLIDSEGPVAEGQNAWQYLKSFEGWDQPEGASESQAYLMVQIMETWFLADRETLKQYFGKNFKEKAIPGWDDLEAIPKARVLEALDKATAACEKKRYAKGKISFEILGSILPGKAEPACPHLSKLLTYLRNPFSS